MMNNYQPPIPSESQEQQNVISWAQWSTGRYPELEYLHHIPNGGARSKATAGRLRAEGVKPGVPDLHLPVPLGGYHGLYIEMKRRKGGTVSDEQKRWINFLLLHGYAVYVCKGADEAITVIENYLSLKE